VNATGDHESFRTPQDFSGDEEQEGLWFACSASLRIFGDILDLDKITQHLGIVPTYVHRKNDRRGSDSPVYKHDMWNYTAPVNKSEPLHVHIDALWNAFKGHKQYLLQLKHDLTVDVFLGYRSNCDHCGVEVPHQSLEMFKELQIPFGLSIIVT